MRSIQGKDATFENILKNKEYWLKLISEEELKKVQEASKLIWDPSKLSEDQRIISYYNDDYFRCFLKPKSERAYNNKNYNTVCEFITYLGFNEIKNPGLFNFFERFNLKKKRKASLVRFISLEVKSIDDINFYTKKMSDIFNYLVDKGLVFKVLDKMFIVPYFYLNRVCFNLYIAPSLDEIHNVNMNDRLNNILGYEAFVNEGKSIQNFDWSQVKDYAVLGPKNYKLIK